MIKLNQIIIFRNTNWGVSKDKFRNCKSKTVNKFILLFWELILWVTKWDISINCLDQNKLKHVLCVSASQWVLFEPFAGPNHLFQILPSFLSQKNCKKRKIHEIGGLPAFKCYSKILVDTQKLIDSWVKYVLLNFEWKMYLFGCNKPPRLYNST